MKNVEHTLALIERRLLKLQDEQTALAIAKAHLALRSSNRAPIDEIHLEKFELHIYVLGEPDYTIVRSGNSVRSLFRDAMGFWESTTRIAQQPKAHLFAIINDLLVPIEPRDAALIATSEGFETFRSEQFDANMGPDKKFILTRGEMK